jgi:hypothetical protein
MMGLKYSSSYPCQRWTTTRSKTINIQMIHSPIFSSLIFFRIITMAKVSNFRQPQRFRLLYLGGSIGLSLLLTYLFGPLLGLSLFISAYIGIIVYMGRRGSMGRDDSKTRIDKGRYAKDNSNSNTKITYICLTCGRKVAGRTCRKRGSHMKKAVF